MPSLFSPALKILFTWIPWYKVPIVLRVQGKRIPSLRGVCLASVDSLSQMGQRTQRGCRFTGGDMGPGGSYEEAYVSAPGSADSGEVLNDSLWWEAGGR